jgi:GntR family transcriptional regulator
MMLELASSADRLLAGCASLDKLSPVPLYHQLRVLLQQKIESGLLGPNARLPSEDAIASHYGISKITVRQALRDLEHAGLIKRYQGRGTFVAKQRVQQGPRKLSSFTDEMRMRGLASSSQVLEQRVIASNASLANKLELRSGEDLFVLRRLRLADGEPMGIQTAYLPLTLVPGIEALDFTNASLYEVLQRKYRLKPASAREIHFAIAVKRAEAKLLGLKTGAPALAAERITRLQDGRLLEYVESVMVAERYQIVLDLSDF